MRYILVALIVAISLLLASCFEAPGEVRATETSAAETTPASNTPAGASDAADCGPSG